MSNGSVADHFDGRATGYGSLPSWVDDEASLSGAAAVAASHFRVPPVSLLDLGAGTGAFGSALESELRPAPQLVSLDISPGMLTRITSGFVVLADAHRLPLRDSTFDLVVSRQAFHYFDRVPEVLAEVRRVLIDRGCLLISQIVPFENEEDARFWRQSVGMRQPLRRHGWSALELRTALTAAGFVVESEAETLTRGSLNSWLGRYDIDDNTFMLLRQHFEGWMRSDRGLRNFAQDGDDITYTLRWVTLIGRSRRL